MPLPKKVSESRSEPHPVSPNDGFGQHALFGSEWQCPSSTHSKKRHVAQAHARVTITTKWSTGTTTRSYTDHCRCQFCGHEWEQEWMPA